MNAAERRRLLTASALGALLAAAGMTRHAPARAASPPAAQPPAAGPFTEVPSGHPAYPAAEHLARELRIGNLYPDGTFSGRRALTRYEFAVAVQRIHQELNRHLRPAEPPAPALRGVPSFTRPAPRASEERPEVFRDADRLRRLLGWYRPLIGDVADVIVMLGADPAKFRTQVDEWQAAAARASSAAAEAADGDAGPGGPPEEEAPGDRPGGFADVPLGHPAYRAVAYFALAGLATGSPAERFDGKQALTRYEFGLALKRMEQGMVPFFSEPLRRKSLPWLRPLAVEFAAELKLLGADAEALDRELAEREMGR